MAGNSGLENAQLGGYADYITDLNLKVIQVFFYEPDQAKKVEWLGQKSLQRYLIHVAEPWKWV